MRKRALWLGVCGVFGALWMAGSGGDLRAGDVDVMGMLRRLQARFVTLDARVAEIKYLGQAAKQQADTAKLQADAAKQASERAVQEAKAAKQQAAQEAAQARRLVEAAQRAAEAAKQASEDAERKISQAKTQVHSAELSAKTARAEAMAAKQAVASLEHRLQQQAQSIQALQTLSVRLENLKKDLARKAGQSKTFVAKGVTFVGRWIPAGSFLMGSPASEVGRNSDEGPQRSVRISRGFWMMEGEVTQGLYKAVMGSNPSHFSSCGERCPVEQVSWHDAALFANKVSEHLDLPKCFVCHGEGKALRCGGVGNKESDYIGCNGWRLPTEAEWEYAARAGTKTYFHMGNCISTDTANYDGYSTKILCSKGASRMRTISICSLARNAWGLCDIHGNVSEWVYDWYDRKGYEVLGILDPVFVKGEFIRVNRGGSLSDVATRTAFRFQLAPTSYRGDLGFRLVRR